MGGIGKSVIAASFARACDTRRAFGDGVIWLRFGQQANPLRNIAAIARAFNDDPQKYLDLDDARLHLPELLATKNCLIILDDVWKIDDAAPIVDAAGQLCRLLITSRDAGLVRALGAQEHRLDVLDTNQALALLANWAGEPVEKLPAEAGAVADECGYLPLALSMAGAMVAGNPAGWKSVLNRLRKADLEKIEQQFRGYPYPNLLKAIQVSVDALDGARRQRYFDFAVFPEDTPIPAAALTTFWLPENLDEDDTTDFLNLLVNRSLLKRIGRDRYTLHDLQFDFVRKQIGDKKLLHRRLIDAYRQQCQSAWADAPDDDYLFDHLAHHFVEADLTDDLYSLIDKPWMVSQFKRSLSHAPFASDVALAIQQSRRNGREDLVQEVRCCFIRSMLQVISSNVPVGVIGVLTLLGDLERARGLVSLIAPDSKKRRALRFMGLALIERRENEEARKALLSAIPPPATDDIYLMAGIAPSLIRLGEMGTGAP
jgi:hypothetical protein